MYEIKTGLAKAGKDFLITAGAVAGAAVCGYYADQAHLVTLLGFLPDTFEHLIIPVISSALVFALNWFKHRGDSE